MLLEMNCVSERHQNAYGALARADAVLDAEIAIERALDVNRRGPDRISGGH
jgi:hypothetical protein